MLPVVPDVDVVVSSTDTIPLVTNVVTVAAAAEPPPRIPSRVPVNPVAVTSPVIVMPVAAVANLTTLL